MAMRDVKVRLDDKGVAELALVRAQLQRLEPERAVSDAMVLRACLAEMARKVGA